MAQIKKERTEKIICMVCNVVWSHPTADAHRAFIQPHIRQCWNGAGWAIDIFKWEPIGDQVPASAAEPAPTAPLVFAESKIKKGEI